MITPLTLFLTLVLSIAILNVPRNKVIIIYVIGMCFVPADQAVIIAGLDFKVLRIFGIVGVLRILMKGESFKGRLNVMDVLYFSWVLFGALSYILLWRTTSAIIFRSGLFVDTMLLYYVFRCYVTSLQDIEQAMKALLCSMIVMTPLVFIEHFLQVNPFYIMGRSMTSFREGRIRCSAAFSHAILLGSFAASIVPICIALYKANFERTGKRGRLYVIGILSSVYVTIASASSGPVLALVAGITLMCFFKLRRYMGLAIFGLFAGLMTLQLFMEKPIWHLFARIDLAGGSTGYHRYKLYDQTINHFTEWVLWGVKSVEHWGIWAGDVTSMYIYQAVRGGFLTLLLFCCMLILCFRVTWKCSMIGKNSGQKWLMWGFFSSLATHAVSFLSVSYFGQINMLTTWSIVVCAFLITNKRKLLVNTDDEKAKPLKRRRDILLYESC